MTQLLQSWWLGEIMNDMSVLNLRHNVITKVIVMIHEPAVAEHEWWWSMNNTVIYMNLDR